MKSARNRRFVIWQTAQNVSGNDLSSDKWLKTSLGAICHLTNDSKRLWGQFVIWQTTQKVSGNDLSSDKWLKTPLRAICHLTNGSKRLCGQSDKSFFFSIFTTTPWKGQFSFFSCSIPSRFLKGKTTTIRRDESLPRATFRLCDVTSCYEEVFYPQCRNSESFFKRKMKKLHKSRKITFPTLHLTWK